MVVWQGDLPVVEDIVLVFDLLEHALGEVFSLVEIRRCFGIAAGAVTCEDELGAPDACQLACSYYGKPI